MRHYRNYCLLFSYLIFGLPSGSSRKYDIEAESHKLYGEDLQSVLKRFRKTPEYLTILEAKLNDLKMDIEHIVTNLLIYYEDKISDKVEEILGANHTYIDEVKRKFMSNHYSPIRRQSASSVTPSVNVTGVKILDSYKKLRSDLTVEERNHFKDIGFEFTGHTVHALINSIADDGNQLQSTLLPYNSDDDKKHSTHVHQVTSSITTPAEESLTIVEGHELHTQPPDNHRNYQHNIL